MESGSFGGLMRDVARGAVGPVVREGRIVTAPDAAGHATVAVRSLMGDVKTLAGVPGVHPIAAAVGGDDPITAQAKDRCWVALDEVGGAVVVQWEPTG